MAEAPKHSWRRRITNLDAFPKVERQLSDSTQSGGYATVLVMVLMAYLFVAEFMEFWTPREEFEFFVDQTVAKTMQINLDITVNMRCEHFTTDVIDKAGSSLRVSDQIKSYPVNFADNEAPTKMGAFLKRALNLGKTVAETPATACRVVGSFDVNKVAGNLHITALGHGHGGQHIDHDLMNFTHRINKLSFGIKYPNRVDPLDTSVAVAEGNLESFQYFVTVVPTIYNNEFTGRSMLTSQFAVKMHQRGFEHGGGVPGIFFKYEIGSVMVRVTERGQGLIETIVRTCAIGGGLFVTVGLVHSVLYLLWTKVVKRNQYRPLPTNPLHPLKLATDDPESAPNSAVSYSSTSSKTDDSGIFSSPGVIPNSARSNRIPASAVSSAPSSSYSTPTDVNFPNANNNLSTPVYSSAPNSPVYSTPSTPHNAHRLQSTLGAPAVSSPLASNVVNKSD